MDLWNYPLNETINGVECRLVMYLNENEGNGWDEYGGRSYYGVQRLTDGKILGISCCTDPHDSWKLARDCWNDEWIVIDDAVAAL